MTCAILISEWEGGKTHEKVRNSHYPQRRDTRESYRKDRLEKRGQCATLRLHCLQFLQMHTVQVTHSNTKDPSMSINRSFSF